MGKTAYVIARDLARIRAGESVLITLDGLQDWKPAEEIAKAAEALGAKVLVAWHSTPPGYGKVADPGLPDALKAAIPNTDVWIELNNQWLLYSSPWEEMARGGRVRYLFLGGLNVDQMVRCIGRVNVAVQEQFQTLLVNLTKSTRKMRITTPAGTDVTFENDPARPVTSELYADVPGPHFLLGQIAWAPVEESINGRIVYDGSFSGGGEAELGILKEPIALTVERGRSVEISGGREAQLVERWLRKLDDPGMYNAAHVCYGFNPGARLSGLCTEDERVWGCTEWGFGYQGPHLNGKAGPAKSHFDGICLNSSVWLDGEELVREGRCLHPELAQLARQLGRE
jgi:leucyl aminopeptidase (aminopeptidase T)